MILAGPLVGLGVSRWRPRAGAWIVTACMSGALVFGREQVVNLLVGIRRTAPSTGIPLESVTLDIVEATASRPW